MRDTSDITPVYVAFAHLIVDDLELADGSHVNDLLGGAGTYAALGASLAGGQRTALTCGVGADLSPRHRAWLRSCNVDTTALVTRGPHTPRSRIVYGADGTRTETPIHGHDHFASMEPAVGDLPAQWDRIQGVYFFAAADAPQWPALLDRVRLNSATVLWEISADSCRQDRFDVVTCRMRDVDVLSINLDEARALCAAVDPLVCLTTLRSLGPAVIALRTGPAGSLIAAGTRTLQVGAAPVDRVVDPTGAGNCYSGAFLSAWCQTHDPGKSAALAAASAAMVLGHFGVPPPARAGAQSMVTALAAQVAVHDRPACSSSVTPRSPHERHCPPRPGFQPPRADP
jgi:sugar/nucleoside kinase (ribokinase family)